MVKVRTKILFAFLVLVLLCSVQAIAAADGDDANLAINDAIDSNVKLGDIALDGSEYLAADDDATPVDNDNPKDVTVFVTWKTLSKDGYVNSTENYTIPYNSSHTITQGKFDGKIVNKSVDYDNKTHVFTHWTDDKGNNVTGDQTFYWAEEDYNVTYEAQYDEFNNCYIEIEFIMKNATGNVTLTESNTIGYKGSWNVNETKFNNKIANYRTYDVGGKSYVFSHWTDVNGTNVTGTQYLPWAEEPYKVTFIANYVKVIIASLKSSLL